MREQQIRIKSIFIELFSIRICLPLKISGISELGCLYYYLCMQPNYFRIAGKSYSLLNQL